MPTIDPRGARFAAALTALLLAAVLLLAPSTVAVLLLAAQTTVFAVSVATLAITSGATLIAFQRNLASPATNFVITTGCTQSGTFVPMPVAPVSNN